MDKLKEKLSRLMYGRYGIDQLGNFMMWAAVAMMIFGAVVRMIDMGRKQFIPAIIKYTKTLADTVNSVKAAGVDASVQLATLDEITVLLKEASRAQAQLEKVTETASSMDDGPDKAAYYYETVCPAMEDLRAPIDKLEMIVDKEAWPMPSYGDLIFEV